MKRWILPFCIHYVLRVCYNKMKYGWIFKGKRNLLLPNAAMFLNFANFSISNCDRDC